LIGFEISALGMILERFDYNIAPLQVSHRVWNLELAFPRRRPNLRCGVKIATQVNDCIQIFAASPIIVIALFDRLREATLSHCIHRVRLGRIEQGRNE
jgi:hypothetical protein